MNSKEISSNGSRFSGENFSLPSLGEEASRMVGFVVFTLRAHNQGIGVDYANTEVSGSNTCPYLRFGYLPSSNM